MCPPDDCPQTTVSANACHDAAQGDSGIASRVGAWLPALYEDSLAIRPLFGKGSEDGLWRWCVNGPRITLDRKIRFDRDVARMIWEHEDEKAQESIVIASRTAPLGTGFLHAAAVSLAAFGLFVIFWYAVTFIAKRVLLIDVSEPDWLAPLPLSPSLGDHIFLTRRDRDVDMLTANDPLEKGLPFLRVSLAELDRTDTWQSVLETLDSSEPGQNVRVVDFEYGINDGAINEKKLQWLERLLALPDRTVIIVSSVSAAYIMTTPPPPAPLVGGVAYLDRWRALLDRFVCVTVEELELRDDEWQRRKTSRTASQLRVLEPKTWLEKETAYNSFLRRLGKEIEAEAERRRERGELDTKTNREHLIDEIGERAETYYAGLWSTCNDEEKLLLYQLAKNGLANAGNRRLLRRLMARGLVRRDPNLELFSETFRLFVLSAAQREDLVNRARAQRSASTWDSLRVPFFIIIISFLLLIFATQKDLLTTTTALATALATGLPVMMKLVGVFTERRAAAAGT
jgi:hypothetical protein